MSEVQTKADEWLVWYTQNTNRRGEIVDINKRTEFLLKGLKGALSTIKLLADELERLRQRTSYIA